MVTIHEEPDCGNAPRKVILRDLVVALAEQDAEYVSSLVTDNIAWELVGEQLLTGRDAALRWVNDQPPADHLEFGVLLTHGRGASVNGVLTMGDGSKVAFCHVLRFAGAAKTAKLAAVNSYVIPLPASAR